MFCASFPMCILYKYLHKVFRNLLWQSRQTKMKISSSQTTVRTPSAYTYSNAYGNYGGMKCSLVRRTDGKNSRFAYKHSTLIVSCVYIHNLQHRHERCIRANHISSHQMELVPSREKNRQNIVDFLCHKSKDTEKANKKCGDTKRTVFVLFCLDHEHNSIT